MGDGFGIGGLEFFACRDAFLNFDVMCLYKLRSFYTTRSALALVDPVDGFSFWHGLILDIAELMSIGRLIGWKPQLKAHAAKTLRASDFEMSMVAQDDSMGDGEAKASSFSG